jgi:hypothetical protein
MKLSKTQWALVIDEKTGKTEIHIPKQKEYNSEAFERVFNGVITFLALMAELTGRVKKIGKKKK